MVCSFYAEVARAATCDTATNAGAGAGAAAGAAATGADGHRELSSIVYKNGRKVLCSLKRRSAATDALV